MNKRKQKFVRTINKLTVVPIILLPAIYWSLMSIQRFQSWYIIPLISIPVGLILNKLLIDYVKSKNHEITTLKNQKGFMLAHITGAISVIFTLFIFTLMNVFIIVESKKVEYKINKLGDRGVGKNKSYYVEIIHDNGKLEKIDFGKPFIIQLSNKDKVELVKHKSLFGLFYHDRL